MPTGSDQIKKLEYQIEVLKKEIEEFEYEINKLEDLNNSLIIALGHARERQKFYKDKYKDLQYRREK